MRTPADDGVVLSNHARIEWTWQHVADGKGHEFQAMIIDFQRRKILVERETENWILRGCLLHWSKYESSTDSSYLQAVTKHLTDWAWPIVFLRLLWNDEKEMRVDGMNQRMERFVAMFQCNADSSMKSKHCQWVDLNDARVYHQVQEANEAIKSEIKYAIQGYEPENRFSWERCEWYKNAAEWMTEVLESQCGASLTEAIIYEHSSSLGAILQANTTQGKFFLRCHATLMDDASRTKYLAQAVPDFVPPPVAVDVPRRMMITRDYGEALAPLCLPTKAKERVTGSYVHLQRKLSTKCDELVAAGFPDFRVSVLQNELDHVLTNAAFLKCEQIHASTRAAEQFRYFRANVNLYKEALRKLEELPIPSTVTHNNLGFSNVYEAKESGSYIFVDWADGFVSHPFISNVFGLDEDQLLREWRRYATSKELLELLRVGQKFFSLVRFLLRLREAAAWEEPAAGQSLKEAFNELQAFNRYFRKH